MLAEIWITDWFWMMFEVADCGSDCGSDCGCSVVLMQVRVRRKAHLLDSRSSSRR